jgi:hypothetical protein
MERERERERGGEEKEGEDGRAQGGCNKSIEGREKKIRFTYSLEERILCACMNVNAWISVWVHGDNTRVRLCDCAFVSLC